MNWFVCVIISVFFAVGGQVLLKRGVMDIGPLSLSPHTLLPTVGHILGSPMVMGGIVTYVAGTFFWLIVLSRVDLSYAYPFASLNYVFILFASWFLFHEEPSARRFIGVGIVIFGLLMVSLTMKDTKRERRGRALLGRG